MPLTRREALLRLQAFLLTSPLLRAQAPYAPERIAPLEELLNTLEIEAAARQKVPKPVYDHIAGGAGDERTLQRNRAFFERITFRPRMLNDVSQLDLSVELFGQKLFSPIIAGPSALHSRVHPEGEVATRQGAAAAQAVAIVSERPSQPLDRIAAASDAPWWRQLSPSADTGALTAAAQASVAAGAKAIVFTIDAAPSSRPDADVHNQQAKGAPAGPAGRADAAVSLKAIKAATSVPVLVKGVLTPADAKAAVDSGADGVCVSNHGGRAVDGLPASIEALPAIVDAVGASAPVLIDGGFRRGSDVLKALAFGARGVLLGRPVLWGLAWGAPGVQRVLELVQSELALAMGLAGQTTVAALKRDLVKLHRW